jgi:hypothetical protein
MGAFASIPMVTEKGRNDPTHKAIGQMAEDDDSIETVVYQGQQAAKQLCKGFHRPL